jgi:hypothetical protein
MFYKLTATLLLALTLSGCSTIQKYWPRAHDPQMVRLWVDTQQSLTAVDCQSDPQGWAPVTQSADRLALYTEFRKDPQMTNMRGLATHAAKMNQGVSKTFCELGKRTAQLRLSAAQTAWEGR